MQEEVVEITTDATVLVPVLLFFFPGCALLPELSHYWSDGDG